MKMNSFGRQREDEVALQVTVLPPSGTRRSAIAKERSDAFRLRYDVYIAEQGKPYPEADHHLRMLSDGLDHSAEILVAKVGGVLAGTVRSNCVEAACVRKAYAEVFEWARYFPSCPTSRVVLCSRLAVLPNFRQGKVRSALFEAIYQQRVRGGTRLCLVSCAPAVSRIFRAYGFVEYAPPVIDPVVGSLIRMKLDLLDLNHLENIKSPFRLIARREVFAERREQGSPGTETQEMCYAV
jgi:predicted GNAT family N-acyltransferase